MAAGIINTAVGYVKQYLLLAACVGFFSWDIEWFGSLI